MLELLTTLVQTLGPVGAILAIALFWVSERRNGRNHDISNPSNHDILVRIAGSTERMEKTLGMIPETHDTVRRQDTYIHEIEDNLQGLSANWEKANALNAQSIARILEELQFIRRRNP